MGHVDHGKTSAGQDSLSESYRGGSWRHYPAHWGLPFAIMATTSLSQCPGHEAFTAMRARGASITDIVILVVITDDRVQPQTIEAINHARAAEVPLIVAVNKVDKPDSSPTYYKLLEHNLVSKDGGDTIMVPVRKTGDGIDNLLEMVLLQAEVLELKAFYDGPARGQLSSLRSAVQGSGGNCTPARNTAYRRFLPGWNHLRTGPGDVQ